MKKPQALMQSKKSLRKYEISASPLYRLGRKRDFAALISWKGTTNSLSVFGKKNNYQVYKKQIKPGKIREIENPLPALKLIQKVLLTLLARISVPAYLHSGTKGRSYLTNSNAHRFAKGATLTLDIEKYYPSITHERVVRLFIKDFKCTRDIAELIANLLCCNGHLATGSPASSLVSFFVNKEVFDLINKRFSAEGKVFSLYVDDISITAPCLGRGDITWIMNLLFTVGLTVKKEKTRLYKSGSPRLITGRVLKNGVSRAPNQQHLKLRQVLKTAKLNNKNVLQDPSAVGIIRHVAMLEEQVRIKSKKK